MGNRPSSSPAETPAETPALGCMKSHQRNAGVGIVLICIRSQGGVVEELGQCFSAHLRIVSALASSFRFSIG